jgi:hypothetical protein
MIFVGMVIVISLWSKSYAIRTEDGQGIPEIPAKALLRMKMTE